jgi:hypothetical protein
VLVNYHGRDGLWPTADQGSTGSVWATAVAVNALIELSPNNGAIRPALQGVLETKPQEAFWLWSLKFGTTDTHVRFDPNKYGWGWVLNTEGRAGRFESTV